MIHRAFASLVSGGLAAMLLVGPFAGPVVAAPPPGPALPSDFNGDGYQDLAVGVPHEKLNAIATDGGLVNVIYGSATGLTASGDQAWSLDTPGVKGTATRHSEYGGVLASGDFDGDGYADLAAGVRFANVGTINYGGLVSVLYGGPGGLTARDQLLVGEQLLGGILERNNFGDSLAAGDFDANGFVDLAIGGGSTGVVPGSTVVVVPGSATGLAPASAAAFDLTQTTGASSSAFFGWGLAAASIDGDAYTDLVVGASYYRDDLDAVPGAIDILHGSANGLDATTDSLWTAESIGVGGDGLFGRRLATGDIDGDGRDEIAIGLYDTMVPTCACIAGSVVVLSPGDTRDAPPTAVELTQDSAGVPDVSEWYDQFGAAVALGDVDGDGHADLAIGTPHESLGDLRQQGSVTLLYGSSAGLDTTRHARFSQSTAGVPSAAELDDHFGAALTMLGLGRGRQVDLVVGVPDENVGSHVDAGMVNVLYGTPTGLSGSGAQGWSQDSTGIKDAAETGDGFGTARAQ